MVLRESGSSPPIIFSQLLFVGMYAPWGGYNVRVSEPKRYYGLNHLHYLKPAGKPGLGVVPEDAGAGHATSRRPPSCALSGMATEVLRHEHLEPEEAR